MKLLFLPFLLACGLLFGQQEANLLGTWNDPELEGSFAYDNTYNEIWGLAINGHEYAIIGSTAGTHFIDVTDPTQPFEAHFVAGAQQGGVVVHRDYHDYNGYLYAVCDEGASSLQIIDFRGLPDAIEVVYDSATKIQTAHNIFIDTATAKLYVFAMDGGPQGYSAMRIYDISDPLNLVYRGEFNNFGGLQVGHVHDGYVRDDIAFLNSGGSGFAIMNFADPSTPEAIATLTDYPFRGYNHSGWLSDDARYYYMADENHGYDLKILDVSDPCELQVVGTFDAEVANVTSIPHNQLVACNYLYVSYYYDGLRVYDISDPVNPELTLYYDTYSAANGSNYKGAWGVFPFLPSGNILISDMQSGLFVFEGPSDGCDPIANLRPVDISCLEVNAIKDHTQDSGIQIFPQPASELIQVSLTLPKSQEKVNAQLLDINGRSVQRFENVSLQEGQQTLTFDLGTGISAGVYYLQLQSEQWQVVEKVLIQ
ncbi:MAG TPA: choice-of-anchor B family protein [Saprospiraceae bacterium]|nr:choice-of-anchor B family protein [Saprospiraceae bacterium]HMQ84986.1 choice-of-anchor B family protein [Saprospiraceae bacterium]